MPYRRAGALLTFEDGAVVHPATGADAKTGNPLIVAGASALAGSYSLGVSASTSFATVSFKPRADLFVSFLVRMNRETGAQIVRVALDQPGAELQLHLGAGKVTAWSVESGSQATLGTADLAVGEVKRIGMHYHAGTTSGEAELFAGGATGPMSRAGGTSSSAYRSTVSAIEIGATTATAFDGSFDDIRIATDGFGL